MNPFGYRLAVWRMSLPDGGSADNEVDVNANYMFPDPTGQWLVRNGSKNAWGVSADIVNPKLYAPQDNSTAQFVTFDAMRSIMFKHGWRLAKFDEWGYKITTGDPFTSFWFNHPMNKYACQTEPLLPQ
jgi:hypothetical protein